MARVTKDGVRLWILDFVFQINPCPNVSLTSTVSILAQVAHDQRRQPCLIEDVVNDVSG